LQNWIKSQITILEKQLHYVLKRKQAIERVAFVEYFKKTYLKRYARFPLLMWNHYDNHDERTNNRVEGDNNKMKHFCGAAHPKIDKCVALLKQYETTAKDKYNYAKKESARAPPQALDVATRDTNFRQARRFHRQGIISLTDYIKQIINLYKFEPKKKYVEELEVMMSQMLLQSQRNRSIKKLMKTCT